MKRTATLLTVLSVMISLSANGQKSSSDKPESGNNHKLITSDISLFYEAFDKALNDTSNAQTIFKEWYFKKGTIGLQDFYKMKINGEDKFTYSILKQKVFYQSIRETLTNINSHSDSIYSGFHKFKEIYDNAIIPNVYFLIGRRTSNGTASKNGLLIGAEVMSKTKDNSVNWSEGQKKYTMNFSQIPVTVFHEVIHFNQNEMKKEKTLLKYAIIEGSAEFITELICGQTDGDYSAFQRREKAIWTDFQNEMSNDVYDSWLIENEPKRPRNAMYWVGYWICKSYYDNATDKKQAVFDILHIKNYKDFYIKSKVDDLMNKF